MSLFGRSKVRGKKREVSRGNGTLPAWDTRQIKTYSMAYELQTLRLWGSV